MLRVLEDIAHCAYFNQLAGIHHTDSVGELRYQTHIVSDQKYGGVQSLLQSSECLHYLPLHHHIQRARRLVSYDHVRIQRDADCHCNALLHSAAQFVRM